MLVTSEIDITTNVQCTLCGITMFMSREFQKQRRADHNTFHCLNGHRQWYPAESEEERLRKALHASELLATRRASELAAAVAAKANALRTLAKSTARTKAGICPCCNRTFKQLAAHMKNKHPD